MDTAHILHRHIQLDTVSNVGFIKINMGTNTCRELTCSVG